MANLITDRQWLESLVEMEMSEDMKKKTQHKLEVLYRNAGNTSTENAELLKKVEEIIKVENTTYASQVSTMLDITVQKASYLLRNLENEGIITSTYGVPSKESAPVKIYSLA